MRFSGKVSVKASGTRQFVVLHQVSMLSTKDLEPIQMDGECGLDLPSICPWCVSSC